jgi:hypothetical protein
MAIEAGEDISIRMRFERDLTAQPGGNGWRRDSQAFLFSGSAQAGVTSGMREKRSEFAFQPRPVEQSEFYRNIVKSPRRETAIEMPQSRNDYSNDRDLNVGPRLIEDKEIEACAPGDVDAGIYLLARVVERADFQAGTRLHRRIAAWRQKGMVLHAQWSGAVEARFLAGPTAHETDGQELVEFSQRTQHGNALIEMSAGTELDIFLSVLHPVQYRHIGGNAEIAGNVEHPKLSSGFGKLGLKIAGVGVIELAEIDFHPLRSIVPPDRVGIPFDQL